MKKILVLLAVVGMGSMAMAGPITLVNADFEGANAAGQNHPGVGWTVVETHGGGIYSDDILWPEGNGTKVLAGQARGLTGNYIQQAFLTSEATADSFEGFNVNMDLGWRADNGIARSFIIELWNVTDDATITSTTYNFAPMATAAGSPGFVENKTFALTYDNTAASLLGDEVALRITSVGDGATFASTIWLDNVSVTTIPEPATLGMVAAFGGGILMVRRKLMM